MSNDTRDKIFNYLNVRNNKDKNLRREPINSVGKKKNDIKNKIINNICPKCGNLLVIRNGKYGVFKGCTNYPRCKFTINLE